MKKDLHAVQFNGMTFGMSIDCSTIAYKNFKKNLKYENAMGIFGTEVKVRTIPYMCLAAIMEEAHWLVSEEKCFNKIRIDGFADEDIYVKYTDYLDFRNRKDKK